MDTLLQRASGAPAAAVPIDLYAQLLGLDTTEIDGLQALAQKALLDVLIVSGLPRR